MRLRLALAAIALLVACGAAPTKDEATKIINRKIDDPLLGAVTSPSFFLRPDAQGRRGMELFESCQLPQCVTHRTLRDLGLITVQDDGFDRGLCVYAIFFTKEGQRYVVGRPVGEIQPVRIGRYLVKEITKIRAKEDEATVYFTMQFTDTTPFYGRVEQHGFLPIRTEPIERVAHFVHNGKRWKLKDIGGY